MMPTTRYTIPVDQVLIGILSQVLPGVDIQAMSDSQGFDHFPSIFFEKSSGSSVGASPPGKQLAVNWQLTFACLHDSADNAELLADWLYQELEKLVDPNVPGFNPIVFEGVCINNIEESELPQITVATPYETGQMVQVSMSLLITFRRV